MPTSKTCILAGSVLALAIFGAACGGGHNAANPNPPGGSSTTLTGQLEQDSSAKVASAASASLTGATATLLDASSGNASASQTVDATGNFSFTGLNAGDRLLRIQFNGNADFDGDGSVDKVDLLLPVTIQSNANSSIHVLLTGQDMDSDGHTDSIEVQSELSNNLGLSNSRLERLDFRGGQLTIDANGNTQLNDDTADVDVDHDGIPDLLRGGINALHGGMLHGQLSAVSSSSLTVDGVNFMLTSATQFKAQGDTNADRSQFTIGKQVLVRGLWNGTQWLALEVKLTGQGSGGGSGLPAVQASFGGVVTGTSDVSLSVGDDQFILTADTQLKNSTGGLLAMGSLAVGDIVLVKATFDGSVWTADSVTQLVDLSNDSGTVTATFNGSIEALTAATLTLHDKTINITGNTQWMANGSATADTSLFDVGDGVQVQASFNGSAWTATSITLTSNNILDDGNGGGGGGTITATFSGDIEAQTAGSLTLHDRTLNLNGSTQWMANGALTADLGLFDLGDTVTVLATSTDGGATWTATQITLTINNVPDDGGVGSPKMASFEGPLTALASGMLSVGTQNIELNADTQWMLSSGLAGNFGLFGVGDDVKVLAEQQGEAWIALKVTLEHKHL